MTVVIILIVIICSFIIVHHLYKIKDELDKQFKDELNEQFKVLRLYQNHINQSIDRIEQSLYQINNIVSDIKDEIKDNK